MSWSIDRAAKILDAGGSSSAAMAYAAIGVAEQLERLVDEKATENMIRAYSDLRGKQPETNRDTILLADILDHMGIATAAELAARDAARDATQGGADQ